MDTFSSPNQETINTSKRKHEDEDEDDDVMYLENENVASNNDNSKVIKISRSKILKETQNSQPVLINEAHGLASSDSKNEDPNKKILKAKKFVN
jgi:hypothetical protein